MSNLDRTDLQLESGDTIGEIVVNRVLDNRQETPCQFCNDKQAVVERGTLYADYAVNEQNGTRSRMCDYCVDKSLVNSNG